MKFLLPVDVKKPSYRVAGLVGCLAANLGQRLDSITILTVMAGSYLTSHIKNIDIRADRLLNSDLIKDLRKQHIEKEVLPILHEIKEKLVSAGASSPIDEKIEDGDPVERITQVAKEGGYTQIFLERRGVSTAQEIFLGSVSAGLLHKDIGCSIYLIGKKMAEQGTCSVKKCLIPLDGSVHSDKALKEASSMLSCCLDGIEMIHLFNVISLAHYPENIESGLLPEKEAEEILNNGKDILVKAGIPESLITTSYEYGVPAKNILQKAESEDVDLIFMGRRGRGAIQEFFMGSVSHELIHKCSNPTVALVS
ncbi:Universal stress protein [Dissulfuribacter thermophilus]|uniref:Universal stress protein n=1 Tax=Dissulfuribacter thermophilus TaxID=1156395 RepID=A0A1B9F883_9BACT|nr:universal stress protein [Dissulfuribacter thermophilus]OCC16147.1 Universal stress protein [Dissulfuribacter thermophilus]